MDVLLDFHNIVKTTHPKNETQEKHKNNGDNFGSR